ncbi:MAG: DUF4093 domain-containing protein [Oscillospiraceae bacterium]|nr:DUF4093 domain-containing protein [Oscillospiraceae bacterium]
MGTINKHKVKISEAVVVEGRYDKLILMNIVDSVIVVTNGFNIRNEPQKIDFIKKLAKISGVIIFTDSDVAGFQIRRYLCSILPPEQVKHAYVPVVLGKEKRKKIPSKDGLMGVEGTAPAELLAALKSANATFDNAFCPKCEPPLITKLTLFQRGLLGGRNSRQKRLLLLKKLGLPKYMSTAGLLEFLNLNMGKFNP